MCRQESIEAYEEYIEEHTKNVKKVWSSVIDLFFVKGLIGVDTRFQISDLIENHDESKQSMEEFGAYRAKFFPIEEEAVNKLDFESAWNHHQKANPHHWQYWIMWEPEGSVALPMEYIYIIEMLCDWTAMSLKFKNIPSQWFEQEKSKMLLHEITINYIEILLPYFDECLNE